jgi:hypothetical protein
MPGSAQSQVKEHARRGEVFAQQHEQGLKTLGRAGVAAEGLVYLLIAWLAAQVALGGSSGSADSSGALGQIASKPFGRSSSSSSRSASSCWCCGRPSSW